MTQVDIAPAAPGWYPDPRGSATSRFWDGSVWTEHVKGPATRFAPPTAGTAVQQGAVAPLVTRPGNGIATAGLVLGIVSLVANLLLIPSILGIVFGAVGAARAARLGGAGRARAITGIALGALGVLAALIQLAVLIPLLLGLQHGAELASLRSTVINQAANQGVRITDVTCPATADLRSPGRFTCDVTTGAGGHVPIAVTVTGRGAWTWQAERIG